MPTRPSNARSRRRTAAAVATIAALAGVAAMLPATGHAKKPPRLVTAHRGRILDELRSAGGL